MTDDLDLFACALCGAQLSSMKELTAHRSTCQGTVDSTPPRTTPPGTTPPATATGPAPKRRRQVNCTRCGREGRNALSCSGCRDCQGHTADKGVDFGAHRPECQWFTPDCMCGFHPLSCEAAEDHHGSCHCHNPDAIPVITSPAPYAAACAEEVNSGPHAAVCAVCDIVVQLRDTSATVYTLDHNGQPPCEALVKLLRPPSDLPDALRAHYTTSATDVHETWRDLLLSPSPAAFEPSVGTVPSAFHLCSECHSTLCGDTGVAKAPTMPMFAIAKGFFMGPADLLTTLSPSLDDLTEAEWNLARLNISRVVWRSWWKGKDDVHKSVIRRDGLCGHALFSEASPHLVDQYLDGVKPTIPRVGDQTLMYHLTGPFTPPERALRLRQAVVRRRQVQDLIAFLRDNNHLYSAANVTIDNAAFEHLPDGPPKKGSLAEQCGIPEGAPLPGTVVLTAPSQPDGDSAPETGAFISSGARCACVPSC